MAETELERAEKRFAQAKARVQALRNREATKQRKLDTRRKVILGGALVDLAARDDAAAAMLDRLIRNLAREQDQAAFVGWDWRAERGNEDAGNAADGSTAEAESANAGEAGGAGDAGGVRGITDQGGTKAGDPAGGAHLAGGDAQDAEPGTASPPRRELRMPTPGFPTHPAQLRRLREEQ